jgi:hypothetical protein
MLSAQLRTALNVPRSSQCRPDGWNPAEAMDLVKPLQIFVPPERVIDNAVYSRGAAESLTEFRKIERSRPSLSAVSVSWLQC